MLQKNQHCVIFVGRRYEQLPDWDLLHLNFSLRSTYSLARSANYFLELTELKNFHYKCKAGHNFEGESMDVVFVKENVKTSFVSESVYRIKQLAEQSVGLEQLAVIQFLSPQILSSVVKNLVARNFKCQISFGQINPTENKASKIQQTKLPAITFFRPNDIRGAEFGTVVILLDIRHAKEQLEPLSDFFTALTRVSTKLLIIMNEDQLKGCQEVKEASPGKNQNCDCLSSYLEKRYQLFLDTLCYKPKMGPRYLILGKEPDVPFFEKTKNQQMMERCPKGTSIFSKNHVSFLHIEDLYKESDLKLLFDLGIKHIVIAPEEVPCTLSKMFRMLSGMIVSHLRRTKFKHVEILSYWTNKEQIAWGLHLIHEFCKRQHGRFSKLSNSELLSKYFSTPNFDHVQISWDKWKEKAAEIERLGGYFTLAACVYEVSYLILLQRCVSKISEGDAPSAVDQRTELSKICWKTSQMFSHGASSREGMNWPMLWPRIRFHQRPSILMDAVRFALNSIIWDAYQEPNYDRIQLSVKKLEEFYKDQLASVCLTDVMGNTCRMEQQISNERSDRLLLSVWDACDYSDQSFNCAQFIGRMERFNELINLYKSKLFVDSLNELINLRKEISKLGHELSERSLRLIEASLTGNSESVMDIIQSSMHAKNLFDFSVKFAMEALKWSDTNKECYQTLFSALDRLEKVVEGIQLNLIKVDKESYLKEMHHLKDADKKIPSRGLINPFLWHGHT